MNEAELFEELDDSSDSLRGAASDLSDVIKKHCGKTNGAVGALCNTLKSLKTTPIEIIGDVLLELNEKAQLATIELNKGALDAVPQSQKKVKLILDEYLKKADILTAEVIKFSKIANELNQNQNRI